MASAVPLPGALQAQQEGEPASWRAEDQQLITGFASSVQVLSSKTCPKKISAVCSDGRQRAFLLKVGPGLRALPGLHPAAAACSEFYVIGLLQCRTAALYLA